MHAPLRANTIPETELGELRFDTRSPSSSDGNELMPIGAQDRSTERRAGMTRETRGIAPVRGHDSEWSAPACFVGHPWAGELHQIMAHA